MNNRENITKTLLLCLAFTRSTYTMDHETRIDFKARKSVFERNSSTQAMSSANNIEDQKKKTSTRSRIRDKTILEKSSIPNEVRMPVDRKNLSEPENDVCIAFQGLDLSSVQHIGTMLQSKRSILEQINGRDITVILGNTGSGKSTMINFLARAPMLVDIYGNFIPQDGRERVKVRAGGISVTKFPELVLETEIGDLCDLPGFQDSGGAVDDLLNAVFMREVLTRAKSVRALMITTQAELKAVRADPFRKLSIFMNVFSKREFRNSSCYLIVNRVERNLISQGRTSSLFEGAYGNLEGKDLFLKELIDSGKVFFIPAARAPETDEEAEEEREKILAVYEEMVRRIISVPGAKIRTPEINMELTFNADTHQALSMFFYSLMEETFAQHKVHLFDEDNSADQNHKDRVWREFEVILRRNSSFEMLHDFGSRAYESISSAFRKTFEGEYDLHQQALLAKNLQEEASRAEENRKQAERRQKEAEQELLLAIERKKELEKLRLEAENRAKHHSLEAEKAWAKVDESREFIRKAEEEAERAIKLAQAARENAQQNEHEKVAAIENARKKTEELERLRQQARENELKKKEAADKTKQAEQELKRIEEEQIHHRNRCQEMEEFQQKIDKQMRDSKKTKEEAERKLAELETELKSTQESLTSRDKIFEQLRTEVESLRRDQGEVSALRREIEDLRLRIKESESEESRLLRDMDFRLERLDRDTITGTSSLNEHLPLLQLAHQRNHPLGTFLLGLCYLDGKGVQKNEAEAARLFRLSADQGNSSGQAELGGCYLQGLGGVRKDKEEAVRLARLSTDQGNSRGQMILGVQYLFGEGVRKNEAEAVRLFRLSADQGNTWGRFQLGLCYRDGIGIQKNEERALPLLKIAADAGHLPPVCKVSYALTVLRKDRNEAKKYLKLAADLGEESASEYLRRFF